LTTISFGDGSDSVRHSVGVSGVSALKVLTVAARSRGLCPLVYRLGSLEGDEGRDNKKPYRDIIG
jgi:hypothetical protein